MLEWSCHLCTFLNQPGMFTCSVCEATHEGSLEQPLEQSNVHGTVSLDDVQSLVAGVSESGGPWAEVTSGFGAEEVVFYHNSISGESTWQRPYGLPSSTFAPQHPLGAAPRGCCFVDVTFHFESFGLLLSALSADGTKPMIVDVAEGSDAEAGGVKVEDVLVAVMPV